MTNRTLVMACIVGVSGAACGLADEGDDPSVPTAHNCQNDVTYLGPWTAYGVTLVHNEPKTCPVHLDMEGEILTTNGVVKDASVQPLWMDIDVWEGDPDGDLLLSESEDFSYDQYAQAYVAQYDVDFPASTRGRSHDFIDWVVTYNAGDPDDNLSASLQLQYTSDACPEGNCIDMFPPE
jgi:hypothetical protein